MLATSYSEFNPYSCIDRVKHLPRSNFSCGNIDVTFEHKQPTLKTDLIARTYTLYCLKYVDT